MLSYKVRKGKVWVVRKSELYECFRRSLAIRITQVWLYLQNTFRFIGYTRQCSPLFRLGNFPLRRCFRGNHPVSLLNRICCVGYLTCRRAHALVYGCASFFCPEVSPANLRGFLLFRRWFVGASFFPKKTSLNLRVSFKLSTQLLSSRSTQQLLKAATFDEEHRGNWVVMGVNLPRKMISLIWASIRLDLYSSKAV